MNEGDDELIRVLHVDDDEDLTEVAVTSLERERENFEVQTATSASEGLELLAQADVDCIVSDYSMAGLNGLEFLEDVREDHPKLPFILFTGHGSEEIASEAISSGVTDYLQQEGGPAQYERLADRIVDAVEAREFLWGQYRELFEQAPVMYALTRNRGGAPIIEDCNERFCETLGYSREALLGAPLAKHYTAESTAELLDGGGYKRALDAEFTSEERQLLARDGTIVETLLRAAPQRDRNGTVVGTLTLFVDITERKRAEEVLEQARAMEASMDGMAILDTDGQYLYANEAHAEIYGYDDPEVFLGEDWRMCYDEADVEVFSQEGSSALDREGRWRGEAIGCRRDGSRFPQELSLTALPSGELICVVRDITDRKQREHDLEQYEAAIEAMDDAVYVLDEEGRFEFVNRAFTELTGYDAAEVIGNGVEIIKDEETIALFEDILREMLSAGIAETTVEFEIETASDERIPCEDHLTPRLVDGEFQGVAGAIRDITERKRNEARLEALHEGTRAMMNAETSEDVCEIAVETARDVLDLPLTGLWLYDPDKVRLCPTAFTDDAHTLFEEFPTYTPGNSLSWEVFATGELTVYDDLETHSATYNPDSPIGSEVIVPLGEYGVLNSSSTEMKAFDDTDISTAQVLAANTEAALERAEREALLHDREAQLERERDNLAALFENVPDPVYRNRRENGHIVPEAVNPAFEGVFGYDEEQVVGRPITETIVPDEKVAEHEALAAASSGDNTLDAEIERLTATGRRTFLLRSAPIDSPSGDQQLDYSIYTDITERREAEQYRQRLYALLADAELSSEERIGELLALGGERLGVETSFLTQITDGTQRIVDANGPYEKIQPGNECPLPQSYCRKTIETDASLTLRHAAEEGWKGDPAYEEFGLEAYVGSKLVIDGELYGTVCFADQTPREREFSTFELAFVDLVARAVGSELERRQYERDLERQNEQLEEFASVLSHDLRNPLGVAEGYLELLPEDGNEDLFAKIRTAHDRMERIIEDVLTLARQGRGVGDTSTVALASTVEQAWGNVETDSAELLNGADRASDTIEADESRLEQLFENLFRNAIEHGGEDVTIRVDRSPVGFYIEDDGPGIPENEREQVFDHGHTTSDSGTGFGLSIVKQIAEAHGWEITVSEGTDGGARFEIEL